MGIENPENLPKGLVVQIRSRAPDASAERLQALAGSIKLANPLPEATNIFEDLNGPSKQSSSHKDS